MLKKTPLKIILMTTVFTALFSAKSAMAFCGFYVAKADTDLYNSASQVVMVRDEDRTVITMANDFQGDVKDLAMVVPVPTFIERDQINVATQGLVDHLDAYTAPRLVEYFDENPCMRRVYSKDLALSAVAESAMATPDSLTARQELGVTVEAKYTVGEYDILILSAEESSGLIQWLTDNNYQLPEGAEDCLLYTSPSPRDRG